MHPYRVKEHVGAFLKIKHPLLQAFCFLKTLNKKNLENLEIFINFYTLQMPSGQGIPQITNL